MYEELVRRPVQSEMYFDQLQTIRSGTYNYSGFCQPWRVSFIFHLGVMDIVTSSQRPFTPLIPYQTTFIPLETPEGIAC